MTIRDDQGGDELQRASSGYVLDRLHRALQTALSHSDPATRVRAEEKALAWEAVLSGMATGSLNVGSRTPVKDTPAWVTLEVAHGGFATGRCLAEGPLESWEEDLLVSLPPSAIDGITDRHRLNLWFLSDEGLRTLADAVTATSFDVAIPEEGALPVVAWLVENGHDALALDLVTELYPFISRFRFYPHLTGRPAAAGAVVHLSTVGEVTEKLKALETPKQIQAMRETLSVWNPLLDRLVGLWQDTAEGGWPCRLWPSDWAARRRAWLDDYADASRRHTLSSKHRNSRSNFSVLREALARCPIDSSALTGRDVGRVRSALAAAIERRGEPGSPGHVELRSKQADWLALPTHRQIASDLVDRLSGLQPERGIAELAAVLTQARPASSRAGAVEVPAGLARKVERALEAPVEALVERGIIGSAEVLASVLPQINAHVISAGLDNRDLQTLYAQIYAAFRRRRSLLLLNLEHQVRIDELPWVAALQGFRAANPESRWAARQTLAQTTLLTLRAFPQTILPNPMVRELSALAKNADMNIPFVEEVAADIFMGTFTTKWRDAAAIASAFLAGSLYARYYDLPPPVTFAPPLPGKAPRRPRWGKETADDFANICSERAKEAAVGDGSQVARNGAVLEQSQILTTHNLAPLIQTLDLTEPMADLARDLAAKTFTWIIDQQSIDRGHWHARLLMIKNTAYAWRQALFFLSLVDESHQRAALDLLKEQCGPAPFNVRRRFGPVVAGLEAVLDGGAFDPTGRVGSGRRFLGWSVGPHWLLADGLRP